MKAESSQAPLRAGAALDQRPSTSEEPQLAPGERAA